MKIALFVSGNLGLIVLNQLFLSKYELTCVFTDNRSVRIIELCKERKIPTFKGNPRNRKATDFIEEFKIDVLLSINYLFIIENDLINWPNKIAVNFHGSLLPKYRGRTPHVWAIINNEKNVGITAHIINEKCDDGDIIEQIVVPVNFEDTGAIILEKYNLLYPDFVIKVLNKIEDNNFSTIKQDKLKATYFGKRTPEDGLISWDWQKERINNWVRAQAYPYPGAFTFFNDTKIVIDKIKFSEHGYSFDMKNGTILSVTPNPIIKTPNGAVELVEIRSRELIMKKLKVGSILK